MRKNLRKNTSKHEVQTQLELFKFAPTGVQFIPHVEIDKIPEYLSAPGNLWLNVWGLASVPAMKRLGELFNIHPLAQEDIVHTHQRPKVDLYENQLYIVCRVAEYQEASRELITEQISMVLGKNYLLTVQENRDDCFENFRQQLKTRGLDPKYGPDFLMYKLLDFMIDSYFPILERWGDAIEDLQEKIIQGVPSKQSLQEIYRIKRNLLTLRKVLWPQREALLELLRSHDSFISADVKTYLRDCYDHVIHLLDFVETEREIVAGLIDLHVSQMGYRMNEIMKVLTMISTIFIPLTFIVGVYGMNFHPNSPWNMPELSWEYGYVAVWGVMIIITLAMFVFFKKKGWLKKQ